MRFPAFFPAAALCLAGAAAAEEPSAEFRVEIPFGRDFQKAAGWYPFTLRAVSRGRPFNGEVAVSVAESRFSLRRPLALPPDSPKRFFFYALLEPAESGMNRVEVTISEAGGRRIPVPVPEAGTTGVFSVGQETDEAGLRVHQVALFSASLSSLRVVADQLTIGGETGIASGIQRFRSDDGPLGTVRLLEVGVRHRTPGERGYPPLLSLPDEPAGYAGIALLILHDLDFADLSDRQREAVRIWAREGGRVLLIPGGEGWFKDPFVRSLAPVIVDPGGPRSLPAFDRFEKAFGRLGEHGAIPIVRLRPARPGLLSEKNGVLFHEERQGEKVALIQRFPLGRGEVIVFGFDPGLPPFANLRHTGDPGNPYPRERKFWSDLFTKILSREGEAGPAPLLFAGPDASRTGVPKTFDTEMSKMPDLRVIAILMVTFLVVVGPLNYFLLNRRGKLLWTAFSIPAISIFFFVLILGVGYLIRGMKTFYDRLAFLEPVPGTGHAEERGEFRLFSSFTSSYDVTFGRGTLPFQKFSTAEKARASRLDLRMDDEGAVTLGGVPLDIWQAAHFGESATRDLGGEVLVRRGPGGVTLRNGTRHLLSRPILRVRAANPGDGENHFFFEAGGDLRPGEERTVAVPGRPDAPPENGGSRKDPPDAFLRNWLGMEEGPMGGQFASQLQGRVRSETALLAFLPREISPLEISGFVQRGKDFLILVAGEN